jgi:molybdate transport system permease protein
MTGSLPDLDLLPVWVTLRLATLSTVILLVLGTPLAWWIARTRCRARTAVEALVALPLVLPPTVLGFYLLLALGPHGPLGALWDSLGGGPLVFTFSGLVISSVLYSLPFVVQPLAAAFGSIAEPLLQAAACLRASPVDRFFTVALPLARGGLVTAATLGFAHTLGEFGVVLMVGGNIPGKTQVLSIAIYDHVEALRYPEAHWLSAGLLAVSFLMLLAVYSTHRRLLPWNR